MVGLYGRHFTVYSDSAVSVGCFETKSNFKKFQIFRFQSHYLKIGGQKHPGYLKKNEQSMSDLYENKKVC